MNAEETTDQKIPVCLDVNVPLRVEPNPLPDKTISINSYLSNIIPNTPIEYLGRSELLDLSKSRFPMPMVSSLFFHTVHHCFQNHYPLALRPEVLMYLIVNEVATTVNLYPKDYRHLFSTSKEKVRIDIRNDALRKGDPNNSWDEVLKDFSLKLGEHVPGDLMPNFLPRFSTTTPETEAATIVAFMSAVREFYDFRLYTLCGLPKIRLLGRAEDYTKLRESAERLAEPFQKHLNSYFTHLLPVLKKLEQQALGEAIDDQFWSSLYEFNSQSGGDTFNGWISTFINYVKASPELSGRKNREASFEQKDNELFDWEKMSERKVGISTQSIPPQISIAPFTWHYLKEELPMQFVGGVLGIDNVDGYATPAMSYAVMKTR